jgi:hypothetical protein
VRKECALRFVVKFHCAMKGSADFVLPSRDRRVMSDAPLTLIAEPEGEAATDQTRRAPDAGLVGLVMLARFHHMSPPTPIKSPTTFVEVRPALGH